MATRPSTSQSQNQLVIHDPELEAARLRLAGKTSAQIAKLLGYKTAAEVTKKLADRTGREARLLDGETRDSLLELELQRLDALQAAVWDQAMEGDTKAVAEARACVMSRVKVLGLDLIDPASSAQTVLVVSGDTESYVEALKKTIAS